VRRALLALLAALAVLVSCGRSSAPSGSTSLVAGSPSRLTSTLESMQGKPVVVNYWATWCGPCKNEMPRIVAAAKKYDGRVRFLGVDVQDDAKSAAAFIERYAMPFRSLSDPDGDIRNAEKVLGLPVTQFYSPEGDLVFMKHGEIFSEELDEKIEDILALDKDARPDY
jgi:thiol-disulfide isomerase/thioredoxin